MDPEQPTPRTSGRVPESSTSSLPHDPPAGERIGPYEVVREIARGGMATVLAVRDTRDGTDRAMKLLLPLGQADEARTRFRREFRALSRLDHPHVVKVFEWGLRGDRPWFTMELVHGRTLREAVAEWAGLPSAERAERAEEVLVQVARALAYIHERGLVHRDITPGNILLDREGRARLTDFGVVKDLGAEVTAVGEVIGTVSYIAPEQITGESVDARADLYSLGAVLYTMLTGRRPFSARTLQGYLEKHLHQAPRPAREVDPLVPPHLDEICLRLLAKDPQHRYASAAHLLHVLGATASTGDPRDRWPPRLVGRTLVQARIREVIENAATEGTGAVVVLEGTSGQGKSRLLDVAECWARRHGMPAVRTRCRPGDRPFGAFVVVFQELSGVRPSPVLRGALEGEDEVVRERYPVLLAFRELLASRAPCAVVLDELESADPATVELLEYLVHNTLEIEPSPVVFVLARRIPADEEVPPALRLPPVPAVHRVRLAPLVASEVEELVLSVLPSTPTARQLAHRLYDESDGSPAVIADMLRELVEHGLIERQDDGFALVMETDEVERGPLPLPPSVQQALQERLAPLSPAARAVGRMLATSRRSMALDALALAAGGDEDRVMEGLDELVRAGIAVESRVGDVEKVDLAQRRMAEGLLHGVEPADRRALNQRLGEALERHHRHHVPAVVEELAWHFEQAGLAPKAYVYLVQTARKHLNSSLFEESLGYLDRALGTEGAARQLMPLQEADRRLARVHLDRSRALYALGRSGEAVSAARDAERMARVLRDPRLESQVDRELGTQLRNQGDLDEAEPYLRRALERAEEVGDHHLLPMPLYQLGAIAWARGDLVQAERHWKNALATAQRASDERAQGYGYNGLGILAICKGSSLEARRHLERSASLFERLGMLAPLAVARVNLAELYLSTGVLRKALELAEHTISKAREVQHPHGIAMGLALRAQVLLELGRFQEARRNAEEALRLARDLEVADDEVNALATLVQVELVRGDPAGALERLEELRPLVMEHDVEGIAPQVVAWHAQALAAQDRGDEGRRVIQEADTDEPQWPHSRVRSDLARGRALRMLGDPRGGQRLLARALATAEANGYRFYQLLAHQELLQVVSDPVVAARHARIATALSRSLAASLPSDDAQRFLGRGWGHVGS